MKRWVTWKTNPTTLVNENPELKIVNWLADISQLLGKLVNNMGVPISDANNVGIGGNNVGMGIVQ